MIGGRVDARQMTDLLQGQYFVDDYKKWISEISNRFKSRQIKASTKVNDVPKFILHIKGAFPEGILDGTETGITMTDAFRNYVTAEKNVAPDKDRIRFKAL